MTSPSGAQAVYLHGGPNRVEPGELIHQDAMPKSHGRSKEVYFTANRQVAEDAADMRNGLGHGWIHVVEPTGPFEPDLGEPESWKSVSPLRVISVTPGALNGTTPHPPILREPKTAPGPLAAESFPHRSAARTRPACGAADTSSRSPWGAAGRHADQSSRAVRRPR